MLTKRILAIVAAWLVAAAPAAALTLEGAGSDLDVAFSVLPDQPVAGAPAVLSIHDVKFTTGEFAGKTANHVTYLVEVKDAAGAAVLREEWFHSHFDGRVDWVFTFPAAGDYTVTVTPEPTMPGKRTQTAFTVEPRTFKVAVGAAPANGVLAPTLTVPDGLTAGTARTLDFRLLQGEGQVTHVDSWVFIQSAQSLFEVTKVHTHTGDFSIDWTPSHGGAHRATVITTPTGDTPEPFKPTLVTKTFAVAGDAPVAGAARTFGATGDAAARTELVGADYVVPLTWGPAAPVVGQPVRFGVAGIHWSEYDAASDAALPDGLKAKSQTNGDGKTLVSHVTYIVEVVAPNGEREFFADWFHSHFDGALGFRYTFAEAGDYVLKVRPEPTMPGKRTHKAFEPQTFEVPITVSAASPAPFTVNVNVPAVVVPGVAAAFGYSPVIENEDRAVTHTDTRLVVTGVDYLLVVEKIHSHTGQYGFTAALPAGTHTVSGLTTFTGDTPEGDRFAPALFAQTFAVGAPTTVDAPDKATVTNVDEAAPPTKKTPSPGVGAVLVALGAVAVIAVARRAQGE